MRIDLLPQKNAYKASLHTHSTYSDGKIEPKQLAELYHDHGYQVLAITDHEYAVDHSDLNREDFLTLTGYELQIVDESIRPRKQNQRCCHLCLISKDPAHPKHVYFNPESYDLLRLCKHHEMIPSLEHAGTCPEIKEYSREIIGEAVKTAIANNMLVAFNHPVWSLEDDYESYRYLDGIYAMEIYNNHSVVTNGLDEYNPSVYDRMLREGIKTGCIATDDTHGGRSFTDPKCDLFGGWSMILADALEYGTVIRALEQGDFYASTGPEIRELWFDGCEIHVSTSDADRICFTTGGRRGNAVIAEPGSTLREASFRIDPEDIYIRVTVKDACGGTANSRGYFLTEFYSSQVSPS